MGVLCDCLQGFGRPDTQSVAPLFYFLILSLLSSDTSSSNLMSIEIIIDGETQTVTKPQLFAMAARGVIGHDTIINVNGKLATAGKVKGIVFGTQTPPEEQHDLYEIIPPPINNDIHQITYIPQGEEMVKVTLISGIKRRVSIDELKSLAANGFVGPGSHVVFNGEHTTAGKISGIEFAPAIIRAIDFIAYWVFRFARRRLTVLPKLLFNTAPWVMVCIGFYFLFCGNRNRCVGKTPS